jgi:hypothetical protein
MPTTSEEKHSNLKLSRLVEQFTENTDVKVLKTIMDQLKALGHSIDSYSSDKTLLMKCAAAANLSAVEFLIDSGADVSLLDSNQHTAKDHAELYKKSLDKHIKDCATLSPRSTTSLTSEERLLSLLDEIIELLKQPGLKVGSPIAKSTTTGQSLLTTNSK